MQMEHGIRNIHIEKAHHEKANSEVTTYYLSPEELEKYRSMKVENSNSDLAHAEFRHGSTRRKVW